MWKLLRFLLWNTIKITKKCFIPFKLCIQNIGKRVDTIWKHFRNYQTRLKIIIRLNIPRKDEQTDGWKPSCKTLHRTYFMVHKYRTSKTMTILQSVTHCMYVFTRKYSHLVYSKLLYIVKLLLAWLEYQLNHEAATILIKLNCDLCAKQQCSYK